MAEESATGIEESFERLERALARIAAALGRREAGRVGSPELIAALDALIARLERGLAGGEGEG